MTRLALAQRAHLVTELAARGIDCQAVVVADDENLDIARSHGFATVELDNDGGLGRRFNAGYQYAAREGADYLVHIGSDDWLHPDAFRALAGVRANTIIAGRRMTFVDLLTGHGRTVVLDGPHGVIPWIIPRALFERCEFAPIKPDRNRGMDGYLVRGLRRSGVRLRWTFCDPHDYARVDFKSDINLNPYVALPSAWRAATDAPWQALLDHYPARLVDMARQAHLDFREAACPR